MKAGLYLLIVLLANLVWSAHAREVRVAVYDSSEVARRGLSQDGNLAALNKGPMIEAERIDSLSRDTLDRYDVLVLAHTTVPESEGDWVDRIRKWVQAGHGLLVTHDFVGYRHCKPLFPDIAVGTGNAFGSRNPYDKELCVTREHPVSEGFALRDRFPMAYYDYITIAPGKNGVVVLRGVEHSGTYAMSSAAAVVCGDAGKGRFVACGGLLGHIAPRGATVEPVGGEAKLLWNAVHYLAGAGETEQGEDLGGGVYLGPSERNYARNGSLESGTTEGWALIDGDDIASIAILDPGKDGSKALKLTAKDTGKVILANGVTGYTGSSGQPVFPDSRYVVRFWARAEDTNTIQVHPALLFWKKDDTADAKPSIMFSEIPITANAAWALHQLSLTPPPEADRMAVAFVMDPAMQGSAVAFDGLVVNRKDTKGLQNVSVEQIRANCELPIAANWCDSSNDKPLTLVSTTENTPLSYPEKELTLPKYNRCHEDWQVVNLNGNWKIKRLADTEKNPVDDPGTKQGFWKTDFDDKDWPVRPVPSVWNINEDKEYPNGDAGSYYYPRQPWFKGIGWYRHRFEVPANFAGKRVVLRFANIYYDITIYVNGKKMGNFAGHNLPCEFDVTDAIKPGAENVLAVRLFDPGTIYSLDRASCGGIVDDVTIQARPALYVSKALITPHLADSSIQIELTVTNTTDSAVTAPLTANIRPSEATRHILLKGGKNQTISFGKKTFAPGGSTLTLTAKLDKPVQWDPETPFLYEIRFSTGKMPLGKERFGMREFSTNGNLFTLNGKPTRLRGIVFKVCNFRGYNGILNQNRNRAMHKLLLAYKDLGFEMLMPQCNSGTLSEHFREICDEIGFMIFDWPGTHMHSLLTSEDFVRPWIEKRYNNPAYVMVALGNEARDPKFLDVLEQGYKTFKKLDKQCVVCTVTGGAPGIVAPKTDVTDHHSYPGDIGGYPADMQDLIEEYNRITWRYHARMLPIINWEMGGGRMTAVPAEVMKLRKLFVEKPVGYKQALIDQIEGLDPAYHMPTGARWLTLYGMRRYAIDDFTEAQKRGYFQRFFVHNGIEHFTPYYSGLELFRTIWCVKLMTEQNRLLGDLMEGYGYNWVPQNAYSIRYTNKQGKEVVEYLNPIGLLTGEILTNIAFDAYKRVNNPVFICAQPFNFHPISGKTVTASIYAINDLRRDAGPWRVRAIVKDSTGKRVLDQSADIGNVPSLKRKVFDWTWKVPAAQPTGFYTLELFLLQNGKVMSDNWYRLYVMNRNELAKPIDTHGKKIALYDVGEKTTPPGSITTAQVLTRTKLPFDRIKDFKRLNRYDVLVIGRNSMDNTVDRAGERIRKWLESGKRLVQFEQSNPGKISYVPQLNVAKKYGGSVADMIVIEHPVFDGLRHTELWELWEGRVEESTTNGKQGGLYSCLIGPLNRSVLATGVMATPRATNKAAQMLISEVKVGKGVALINQAEATRRYGVDAVPTRYIQNVLRHILSDNTQYAEAITGFQIKNLDPRRFGYMELVDLKKSTKPVATEWVKTMTAETGAPELGNIVFKDLSEKAVTVTKDKPLKIDVTERSKLMWPQWEAEKRKKDVDQRGLQLKRAEAIYFLHTVTDGAAIGDKIGSIVFRYADGTFDEDKLQVGFNIGLAAAPCELEYGVDAGEGYTVTRWVNPNQAKELRSIEIDIISETAKVSIGGISNYLTREKVHD